MIGIIRDKLLTSKNIKKSSYFWNAFSAMMNSFQTMLLLLVITQFGNDDDSSIFVMAYAVGNLMLNIGKYGVRQYQVTDVTEKNSFADYLRARYISVAIMLAASVGYILIHVIKNDYSTEKSAVVFMICMVKLVEAFEDVYHGRMQQNGRLDVAGRILGIRLFIFILLFALFYIVTGRLVLTCCINLIITIILSVIMNRSVMGEFKADRSGSKNCKRILVECLPLCVSMCLNMYIANAPKYTIDTAVNSSVQTRFNIVFMPVFIIALLANFVFLPVLKNMGEIWHKGDTKMFVSKTVRLSALVIAIDFVIVIIGSFIGCPILGFVYGVDLSDFRIHLVFFMIAGGIIALQNLLIMVITTVRYQKYMIYGYIATAVMMVLFSGKILALKGLLALTAYFLTMMIVLFVYCVILLWIAVQRRERMISHADQ